MANLLKTGAKAFNGNAVPLKSNNDGNLQTIKLWDITELKLFDGIEIRDRNWHRSHGNETGALGHSVNLAEYGFMNMRIKSTLDQPCALHLCTDYNSTSNEEMLDSSGYPIVIEIPANTDGWIAVTPQDLPVLNCIRWIKAYLIVTSSTNPTTGSVTVDVYCKR